MKAGNLRQRANGKWQYRASYGSTPSGRRIERSSVFKAASIKDAEKHARALRKQWDDEADKLAAYRGTVRELVEEWQATREHSPTTIYRNQAICARIIADLGNRKLTTLTARDLDAWYRSLKPYQRTNPDGSTQLVPMGPNTVRHYHRVLRAILQQGYKWDMLPANIADKATPPKATRSDQSIYMPTVDALRVMLSHANPTLGTAVLLSAATGARRGEVLALHWSALRDGILTVHSSAYKLPAVPVQRKSTKTGNVKPIPLPAALLDHLVRFRAWQEAQALSAGVTLAADGPIIANLRADLTGRAMHSPDWYSLEWTRLCSRAKVPAYKLHGLRHMHGSLLTDSGVSLAAAAKRQGHGVQVMAERYLHPVDGADLAAADAIGASLAPLFQLTEGGTA